MFCKSCGRKLAENLKFCDGCGTDVNERAAASAVPHAENMSNTNQLTKPAIALLVGGIALALLALFSTFVAFSGQLQRMFPIDNSEFEMFLSALVKLIAIVPLALSGIVIFGAFAMLKRTSYSLSMAGSICGIIGSVLAGCPALVLVLPVSIWAVVALRKPESKRLFDR